MRQKALDELLEKLSFPETVCTAAEQIAPSAYFPQAFERTILEIGFGDGDHLAGMMKMHPDTGFIGAEPYINGMSAFLKQIEEENLNKEQIKVWMDDAIRLIQYFDDACLDQIYVLNPDPWPKARHHKRRIISQENLDVFARLLKPKGQLIMTTDVDDLAEWMVTEASNHSAFEWTASSKRDWQTPPQNWIATKYELKGKRAGRKQSYLIFQKSI